MSKPAAQNDWLAWPQPAPIRHACIVGDGLSGACLARQLAEHGVEVNVLGNGQGSSHRIPALLLRDYAEKAPGPSHRLYQHAYRSACAFYTQHCPQNIRFISLQTAQGQQTAASLQAAPAIDRLLDHPRIERHHARVQSLQAHAHDHWQVINASGECICCQNVVMCTAQALALPELSLPLTPCAGQVIQIDYVLKTGFAQGLHGLPLEQSSQIGSSYRPGDPALDIRPQESLQLLTQARRACPAIPDDCSITQSHTGLRISSLDHLPVIGPAPDMQPWREQQIAHEKCRNPAHKKPAPYLPGLWLNLAHGSRGGTMAPLAGQILSHALLGKPSPLEPDLVKAIHPGRFATRAVRRGEL